ncbi:hypothetical protein [Micromonospora zhanjiangensis]|uniref:Uncharacterized protein n=1 Tax=Micromonospora zhanjiangensis TaxID=1522057 RepID=A0ABV8KW20_9ACTN
MDEVLARLKSAIEQLDTAAITAARSEADARQAETHYREAGGGSDHPAVRGAVSESITAAEKAGKVARLLAETSGHLTAYVNTIVPGAAPTRKATDSAQPTGEELVSDTVSRTSTTPGIESYLNRLTRKADDLKDHAENATNTVQTFLQSLRDRHGPSGSQSTGTTVPTAPPVQPPAKIDAAETAGHIVVVGLAAGIVILKTTEVVDTWLARLKKREHQDRPE